jgi:hypothetical protein
MSVLWTDGFDWVAEASGGDIALALLWTEATSTLTTTTGRYGSGVGASSTGGLRKTLTSAQQNATLFIGWAYKANLLDAIRTILTLRSDTNATSHLTFRLTTGGEIEVRRGTSSGTLLGTTSGAGITAGNWAYIEVKAVLHDTTGAVTIKVNGTARLTLTGQDTKNAGTNTKFEDVEFGLSGSHVIDDVYILDPVDSGVTGQANNDFLGDIRVETLVPTGAGNSTQFTRGGADSGANWSQLDEVVPAAGAADTDYVEDATVNDKDTYAHSNLASSTGSIAAVVVTAIAKKTDVAARGLQVVARSAGTESTGADTPLSTSYGAVTKIFEAEPGGSSWTRAEVDAAEFGFAVSS